MIVGNYGTILRTTDGGMSWNSLRKGVPTAIHLYGISFMDADTGIVVGDGGTILRTTTGGL
jgi:photosystem II stability/assembly factor-like uncharacterized protein